MSRVFQITILNGLLLFQNFVFNGTRFENGTHGGGVEEEDNNNKGISHLKE